MIAFALFIYVRLCDVSNVYNCYILNEDTRWNGEWMNSCIINYMDA